MDRFTSRKFLMTIAFWCYNIGGLVTGNLDTQTAATNMGLTGVAYVLVEGLIDMITAWKGKPA